ncbi:MAG TPA: helix-turn-helix domain-containing protein [Acidisphaera sp.]|nr:helix-turn-helix domain-containing protein [Acidisphaera sp.]
MPVGIEALRSVVVLAGQDERVLDRINTASSLLHAQPEMTILRAGDPPASVMFLLTGHVLLRRPGGAEADIIDVLEAARPLCLGALFGLPETADIVALGTARLIVTPAATLRALVRTESRLAEALLAFAVHAMRGLERDLEAVKLRPAAQRLGAYLLELAGSGAASPAIVALPYFKQTLAARIGCTQENLSRAFARLRTLGVESQREFVTIADVDALKAFVGPTPAPDPSFAAVAAAELGPGVAPGE